MDSIEHIALIAALALHCPWVKDRLDRVNGCKRPAIWIRKEGLWYGWDLGSGCSSSRRMFRWPNFARHTR